LVTNRLLIKREMTKQLPKIIKENEKFYMYSPTTNELVATFENEHFLRVVLQEVFEFSPFEPTPISEEPNNA